MKEWQKLERRVKERYKSFSKGDPIVIEIERFGGLVQYYRYFMCVDAHLVIFNKTANPGKRDLEVRDDADIITVNHVK